MRKSLILLPLTVPLAIVAAACSDSAINAAPADNTPDAGVSDSASADSSPADSSPTDSDTTDSALPDSNPSSCSAKKLVPKDNLELDVTIDLRRNKKLQYTFHENISVTPKESGDGISLFGENFQIVSASVPYSYDGHTATFCTNPFAAGEPVSLQIDYLVFPKSIGIGLGFHSWTDGTNQVIGAFNEPYYASSWLFAPQSTHAVDSSNDDNVAVSKLALHITPPSADWMVVGPGGAGIKNQDEWSFSLQTPTPLYACSFAAALNYERYLVGSTPAGTSVYAASASSAKSSVSESVSGAIDATSWLESNVGPFPFGKEFTAVSIPNFPGGMEHTTELWIGSDEMTGDDLSKFVLAHEASHHYWGDSVRFADWPHIWLAEGFTEWVTNYRIRKAFMSSDAFEQNKLGYRKTAADACSTGQLGPMRFADSEDMMDHFDDMRMFYEYGAAFLQMVHVRLKNSFGTDLDSVLKTWFNIKQGSAATTEEFRDYLIQLTGNSTLWQSFFEQWAFSSSCPTLQFDSISTDGSKTTLTVLRSGGMLQSIDQMPIIVKIGNQDYSVALSIPSGQSLGSVELAATGTISSILVDPPNSHVFALTTSNSWNGPTPALVSASE